MQINNILNILVNMIKEINVFLFRCMRKLGMQSLYYRLLYPFYHSPSARTEREYIERACDRLYTLHPDVGQSSLSQNKLERSFQYDLQIIVPAYNVESYIAECIDSILAQRTSFRILVTVVNDGSTDQTFSVLQRYADCSEVCLIQQENKGFSGARNAALKHIRASYIMFVDADDKLPEGAVESLMRSALRTDADIVEGGYSRFVGERTTFTFRHSESFTRDWSILYGFPVGKVYKSWLFEDVVFPLGYWFEDTICIYLLYPRCKAVATIKDVVYLYRQNEQGITFTSRGNIKTLDALWVTRRLLADSKRMGIPATQALYDMLLLDLSVNLTRFVTLDDMVHQDAFMVSAALLQEYFPRYRTENIRLRPLEQAFLHYDYGAYRLYGKCYLGV